MTHPAAIVTAVRSVDVLAALLKRQMGTRLGFGLTLACCTDGIGSDPLIRSA